MRLETPEYGTMPKTDFPLRMTTKTIRTIPFYSLPKQLVKTEHVESLWTHLILGLIFNGMHRSEVPSSQGYCVNYKTTGLLRKNATWSNMYYRGAVLDTSALVLEERVVERINNLIGEVGGKCNISQSLWDNDIYRKWYFVN